MKKIFIIVLFLSVIISFFAPHAYADMIPFNSHKVKKCIKVVNLNDFPDIVLIGHIIDMGGGLKETYQIKKNDCLYTNNKWSGLKIYWNTKDKQNSVDQNNFLIDRYEGNIESYYVEKSNPLSREDIEYSLARSSDGKLILYKSKQTLRYNNFRPKEIKVFENPLQNSQQNNQSQQLIKKGFWQSLVCFFSNLFDKNCQ